jgi:DNA-binding MarR family transcriptional regulator
VKLMSLDELTDERRPTDPTPDQVAAALSVGLGRLYRRLRQVRAESGSVTLPESSALARLDRGGPATSAELARREQISPQSMGATLQSLERQGLIERAADPADGRRQILTVSGAGARVLHSRRSERTERLAATLSAHFSAAERAQLQAATPLLERLADRL